MTATSTAIYVSYYITTSFIVQLVVLVVFPLLVIGLGVKFMRNLDKI